MQRSRQRSGNAYMSMLPHVRGSPGGTSAGSRPAPSTASSVASNITQVKKRRRWTRRGAHTWFFTALPFLSPFLISLYSAAFVLIFLLATSSHLPPTSQLVQPAETVLKRPLVAHLRDTAQCNNIASKFGAPRCSNPPSTSSITQSAPKVHFPPFPAIDGIACKYTKKD